MTVVAYVPDLMDRSRLSAATADVRFVSSASALEAASAPGDVVVVDLSRSGVLDALSGLTDRRVIGFGSHVERELLTAARSAGCAEVLTRSAFFGGLPGVLDSLG
jgi:hypothetical protein